MVWKQVAWKRRPNWISRITSPSLSFWWNESWHALFSTVGTNINLILRVWAVEILHPVHPLPSHLFVFHTAASACRDHCFRINQLQIFKTQNVGKETGAFWCNRWSWRFCLNMFSDFRKTWCGFDIVLLQVECFQEKDHFCVYLSENLVIRLDKFRIWEATSCCKQAMCLLTGVVLCGNISVISTEFLCRL